MEQCLGKLFINSARKRERDGEKVNATVAEVEYSGILYVQDVMTHFLY